MRHLYNAVLPGPGIFFIMILITAGLNLCNAQASDGDINITGNIIANTCTVSPDDKDKGVDMGKVASKQFADGATVVPPVSFTLSLVDCGTAVSGVSVSFQGTQDTNNADLLALDTGGATGIGIAILDRNQALIPMNTQTKSIPIDASAETAVLQFYAQYTADGAAILSGAANASATFNLVYD
jgi:type 1 fimbria pilin